MGNALFDQFKSTLTQALEDTDFIRKNEIYQNPDFLADALARVKGLTPDISIRLGFDDVINALGMIVRDNAQRIIRFDPRGFRTTLSAFREGLVDTPKRFWQRNNETDGVRYMLSDQISGIFLLNDSLEVLRRFPGFGPNLGVADYGNSVDALTFTIDTTEFLAVACFSRHIVRIYEYEAPFSLVATIGTLDTPGDTTVLLNQPVSLAYDETNNALFIANQSGTPAGATLDNGFISIFDVSTPASPTNLDISHFYENTGSLLDSEIDTPTDVFFDNGANVLWVVNGNNEVGAFTIDTANEIYSLRKFIEPSGASASSSGLYTLRNPEQVYVQELLGGFKRIYVANGSTGVIEEYDDLTLRHLATYGYRASEDELNTFNRLSDSVYGAIGYAQGVVADRVLIDGQEVDVLITSDTLNKRVQQFNLNAYTTDNFAVFRTINFDVPVSINGWTVNGDIPTDMVSVGYRFSDTDGDFRELPQETTIPPSSSIQFRVAVKIDTRRFVRDWHIRYLRINGTQA